MDRRGHREAVAAGALAMYAAALEGDMPSLLKGEPELSALAERLRAIGSECLRARIVSRTPQGWTTHPERVRGLSEGVLETLCGLAREASFCAASKDVAEALADFGPSAAAFSRAVSASSGIFSAPEPEAAPERTKADVQAPPPPADPRSRPGSLLVSERIVRGDLRANPGTLYVFGDNMQRAGLGGQAAEMRGEPNSVGIPTKKAPSMSPSSFFTDADASAAKTRIDQAVDRLVRHLRAGGDVVWPKSGIGTGLARLAESSPAIAEMVDSVLEGLAKEASVPPPVLPFVSSWRSERNPSAYAPAAAPSFGRQADRPAPSAPPVSSMQVVNKKSGALPAGTIDVSRHGSLRYPGDSLPTLRNPYVMSQYGGKDGSREDVVVKFAKSFAERLADPSFRAWFEKEVVPAPAVACYCSPQLCHGHSIQAAADAVVRGGDPIQAVLAFAADPQAALAARGAAASASVSASAAPSGISGSKAPASSEVYAGVGSRETPPDVLAKMEAVGRILAAKGLILRSGGAIGADSAFERGSDAAGGKKEIFIAWQKISNDRKAAKVPGADKDIVGYDAEDERIASAVIAALRTRPWAERGPGDKALQSRNVRQVLGLRKDSPVGAVLAYTKDGLLKGGTATAIQIAVDRGIPVVNLGSARWRDASAEEIAAEIVGLCAGRGPSSALPPPSLAPSLASSAPAPLPPAVDPAAQAEAALAEIVSKGASWGSGPSRDVRVFREGTPDRMGSNMFATPVLWGDAVTPARLWDCNEVPYMLAKTLDASKRDELLRGYERAKAEAMASGKSFEASVAAGAKHLKTAARKLEDGPFGRPDWRSKVQLETMDALVSDKYVRSPKAAEWLLKTGGGRIEEGNTWGDVFWGVALSDMPGRGVKAGQGANHLGRLTFKSRERLRALAGLPPIQRASKDDVEL